MTSEMFDSIDPSQIPVGQDDAGYVDGRWPTFTALHGPHNLSIAVFPADDADAADDEPGDMTNAQAAQWVLRELRLGHWRPCVYTSVSNVAALLAALAAVGVNRSQVRIWTAHYTYTPHRCSPACWPQLPAGFVADATQWTDRSGGRNLDESTIADDFFGPAPSTPPVPARPAPPNPYPVITGGPMPSTGITVPVGPNGEGWAVCDGGANTDPGSKSLPQKITIAQFVSVTPWCGDPAHDTPDLPLPKVGVQNRGGFLFVKVTEAAPGAAQLQVVHT